MPPDERSAALRHRFGEIRARFVGRRVMLRDVLARYLDVAAADVVIDRTCRRCGDPHHGRPRLGGDAPTLAFSLSDAGDAVLLGVTGAGSIGVDVEANTRATGWETVMQRHFTPAEIDAVQRFPRTRRVEAFLTVWTAKEACLKADGRGVAAGIDAVKITLDRGEPQLSLDTDEQQWHVRTVPVTAATVACIATERAVTSVAMWEWKPRR